MSDDKIETVLPKSRGGDIGRWMRTLESVDPAAKDGWGFHGQPLKPGGIEHLHENVLVLECCGAKRIGGEKTYILWQMDDEGDWTELARDSSPAWAITIRKAANEYLEEGSN